MAQSERHNWLRPMWSGEPLKPRADRERAREFMELVPDAETLSALWPEEEPATADRRSLRAVVAAQEREIERLHATVAELATKIDALGAPKVIEVTQASNEEVVERVHAYYAAHADEDIYPSDVAEELALDPQQVHEATEKLVRGGVLR